MFLLALAGVSASTVVCVVLLVAGHAVGKSTVPQCLGRVKCMSLLLRLNGMFDRIPLNVYRILSIVWLLCTV